MNRLNGLVLLAALTLLLLAGCGSVPDPEGLVGGEAAPQPATEESVQARGYPTIVISPTSAAAGDKVSITIYGGYSYATMRLYITDPNGSPKPSLSISTDSSGTARYTWTASTPAGNWRFTPYNYGYTGSPAYVNVTSTPTSDPTHEFSLTTSATSVAPYGTVDLTAEGAPGYNLLRFKARTPYGSIRTYYRYADGVGKATYRWTADATTGGWTFWVEDSLGNSTESTTVNVTSASTASLQLMASDTTVIAGERVAFTTQGGYPNNYVYLYRTDPSGSTSSSYLATNSSGSATYNWTATTPTGNWTFWTRDVYGHTSERLTVQVGASATSAGLTASASSVGLSQNVTLTFRGGSTNSYVYFYRITPSGSSSYMGYKYTDGSGNANYSWTATSRTGNWRFYTQDPHTGTTSNQVTVNVTETAGTGGGGGELGTLNADRTSVSASGDRYVNFTFQGQPYTAVYLGRSTVGQALAYDAMGTTNSSGRLTYRFDTNRSGVYAGTYTFWVQVGNSYTMERSSTVQVTLNY